MLQNGNEKKLYLIILIGYAIAVVAGIAAYVFAGDVFQEVIIASLVVTNVICIVIYYIDNRNTKKFVDFSNRKINDLSVEKGWILNLLSLLTDGLLVFDSEGNSIFINKSAHEFMNYNKDDINFSYLAEIFNIDITLEELLYVESSTKRIKNVNKDDRYFIIEFVASFEGEQRAQNIIVVIRDCTEQQKLDTMRKDFIANVSHELKTPLTSISSYTEALMDGAIADVELANNFLSVVSSEANRMGRLIGDLLQLSQIDRGTFPLNKRRLSFKNLVKECVDKIKIDAENHGLTVESYVIGEIPDIYMDSDRIEQVLLNILSNAIKYTPEKGKISVYTGRTFSQVYAKVSDTGIGIPRESLSRVFERFYRIDKARTREQGGTGLGLAISREIIEAHGGEISIASEFGIGTEVTIKLPVNSRNRINYSK